jgi:hypothetical protein
MLSNTESRCLTIALAVCLKKKEEAAQMDEWVIEKKRRNEYTHETVLKDLRIIKPSDFQKFLRLNAKSFDELLK